MSALPRSGPVPRCRRQTPPAAPAIRFYRITAQDTDTDGDGVSDWEEMQVGFDPNNSHSAGLSGVNDLQALTNALGAANVVTITASAAALVEPSFGGGSVATGTFTIRRTGNINALTVNIAPIPGSAVEGSDYVTLARSVTLPIGVNVAVVTVTPLADSQVESSEAVIVGITAGASYTVGSPATAAIIINDNTQPNGDGALARYWNVAGSNDTQRTTNINSYVTAFPAGAPAYSRVEATIDNTWPDSATAGVGSPATGVNPNFFVSRYTADVLPAFSQVYTFQGDVNTAGRLTVNGVVVFDNWGGNTATLNGTIELQGGRRYPIVFEHMERTGDAYARLRWQSANQPLQIIPQTRLFSAAPPQILSPLEILLIQNSPAYNYQITASGNPTSYSASNLPPGWTINPSTGLISGIPNTAGTWQVAITASNATGSGSAILSLQILGTGGAITRDVWSGITGTTVAAIPLTTPPTTNSTINLLESPQDEADDYGARIRGFITAPSSGLYKFWLTASNSAELYISDDHEPVNAFLRAQVTSPTLYREWGNPAAGISPLLILEAGHRYYIEVRHKAGVGSDHVSVGWLKPNAALIDPAGATAPDEVVPSYALSPYVPPTANNLESTLYTTNLTAQGNAVSSGYGTASLRLSADETEAVLSFTYANLTTALTGEHIHSDAHGGAIIFDIDDATPAADGSYTWHIVDAGAVSAAAIVNVIKTGQAYLNVHTARYPMGEIRGNFRLQAGSQTFTPPPPPPPWTDDHGTRNAASRFLIQSTFGPSPDDLNASNPNSVLNLGYNGWIDYQASLPPTFAFPNVNANRNQTDPQNSAYIGTYLFNSWWRNAVTAPDQLRQRVAFALSEILVTSEDGPLDDRADALSDYYDVLLEHSFGNFRQLLEAVTLHPAMGRYLDMLRNDKPDKTTGRIPNENYAREIQQLFSIGLNRLHPDGSFILDSAGNLIPTYDQNAIIGFAHVFTGWDYNYAGPYHTALNAASNWIDPMREVPARHFTGQKRLLNNVVLPGLPTVGGLPLDPYSTHTAAQYSDPKYQALPAQEFAAAHNALFMHPNCGPFICRQLIQRLVTSTPSRGYLYRVVSAFNNNGAVCVET